MICPQCLQKYAPGPELCWTCRVPLKEEKGNTLLIIGVLGVMGLIGLSVLGVLAVSMVSEIRKEQAEAKAAAAAPIAVKPSATPSPASVKIAAPTITPTPYPVSTPFVCDENAIRVTAKSVKDGFGTVIVWKVTIRNLTRMPLGDFKYNTVYESETGNRLNTGTSSMLGQNTIQKIVPALSSRTFEVNDGFVSSEVDRAGFFVTDCREME